MRWTEEKSRKEFRLGGGRMAGEFQDEAHMAGVEGRLSEKEAGSQGRQTPVGPCRPLEGLLFFFL
jgi:hypothetical protein